MARPKKNGAEQPLNLDGNNMPMENENAQQSHENAAQQQSEEQVEEFEEEDEFPFEIKDGVPSLLIIMVRSLSTLLLILNPVKVESL